MGRFLGSKSVSRDLCRRVQITAIGIVLLGIPLDVLWISRLLRGPQHVPFSITASLVLFVMLVCPPWFSKKKIGHLAASLTWSVLTSSIAYAAGNLAIRLCSNYPSEQVHSFSKFFETLSSSLFLIFGLPALFLITPLALLIVLAQLLDFNRRLAIATKQAK